ncbi:DUF6483 family protein [Jutongia huaianensis]|uniref:Uncharacterized protein n=1 Tax=Jutongia huaianensis TaxID=2763668 RepID=A0ABR7N4X4_9FIRM|nr:DUF6483 family protein [Jutongia huaianensis]MBC8563676.1 hypothetical protein [Jutongia huaianensis]
MEFENNGLKNSIAGTLRLVGILISGAWSDKYKQPKFIENAAQEDFYQRLLQKIDRGEINEAENELLAYMEGKRSVEKAALKDIGTVDNTILDMALSVYGYMNEKEDIFLEQNNYCRQEIEEGIRGMLMRFGVSIPADSWF